MNRRIIITTAEIWKETEYPFTGYLVSNMGGVKRKQGRFWIMKRVHTDKDGYLITSVMDREKGIETTVRIHRLVALNFIPNPENNPVTHHINEIKYDNRAENLEWCTISHNTKDHYNNYDSPNARSLKVTTEDGFLSYYSSYEMCCKAIGMRNRNNMQFFVDKKLFLDFIKIEHVGEVDPDNFNKQLVDPSGSFELPKFNPIKMYDGDKELYFRNGKEAADYFGVINSRINQSTRKGCDYQFGKIEKITKKEYLEKTNRILK